jgi:pyruvate/2-oxoglutarate dehydrogenase complex dihydrolipoamide acyltransferase (E2) component
VRAIRGTGPDGRVTDADVEAFARRAVEQPPASVGSEPERPSKRPLAIAPGFVQGAAPLPPLPRWCPSAACRHPPSPSSRLPPPRLG